MSAAMVWVGLAACAQSALAWNGKVQVAKVNQGGNPDDTFKFTSTFATGYSLLKGGQTTQAYNMPCNTGNECESRDTIAVTEHQTSGYSLTDIMCRHTQSSDDNYGMGAPGPSSPVKPDSEVSKDLANGTVTLKLHYGEWVLCTYTNTYPAPPTSPPPPPGGGTTTPPPATQTQPTSQTTPTQPQPEIEVSPARVRPGSAKLSGPSGCATSDVVVASVSGRRITRVTFYVDNKKVKTLHQANRGSRWVLSMRIRGLAFGSHRVKAKVEFAKSSQTKAKTLPLSFSRCRSAAARPQFTG